METRAVTKPLQVVAYIGVSLCAASLILGALAALFEDAPILRIYGGLTAAMAIVVGSTIARWVWVRAPSPNSAAVAQAGGEAVDGQVNHPQ